MEKIDLEIDDFINYCDYKGLSTKTMASYEQTLKLFARYLSDTYKITRTEQITEKIVLDYVSDIKEREKYTVVINDNSKKTNNPYHNCYLTQE